MGNSDSLFGEFANRCRNEPVEDGGTLIIKCSNCGTELVEIWKTRPNVQVKTKVVVLCDICGDKSFSKIINGGFHIGPAATGKVACKDMKYGETTTDDDNVLTQTLTITTVRNT